MRKQTRVFIPNGTTPRNRGDEAMMIVLLTMLTTSPDDLAVTIQSFEPHLYPAFPHLTVKESLYSWAVFNNRSVLSRILRTAMIVWTLLLPFSVFPPIKQFLEDYEHADVILFAPGGYLRAGSGISQFLNFLMQLIPFVLARRFRKKTILLPVSVGPFPYPFYYFITARVLKNIQFRFVREQISQQLLEEHGVTSELAPDLALFTPAYKGRKGKKITVGFIVREWNHAVQENVEAGIAQALQQLASHEKILIQPIVFADAIEFQDNDVQATERIRKLLGIPTLPPIIPRSHQETLEALNTLDFLVSVRLHGSLLASTQGVPSLVIAYEHKAQGIFRSLGLERYVIPINANVRTYVKGITIAWKDREAIRLLIETGDRERLKEKNRFVRLLFDYIHASV